MHFPSLDLDALRADLTAKIDAELGGASKQVPSQQRRIAKLERERKKLLQAFYAEAIPAELLKEEQGRITREIAQAQQVIQNHDNSSDRAYELLEDLLTLCDDPYALYLCADEPTKRMLNQAVAVRFWIWDERIHTVELTAEFRAIQEQARQASFTGQMVDVPMPRAAAETQSSGLGRRTGRPDLPAAGRAAQRAVQATKRVLEEGRHEKPPTCWGSRVRTWSLWWGARGSNPEPTD